MMKHRTLLQRLVIAGVLASGLLITAAPVARRIVAASYRNPK